MQRLVIIALASATFLGTGAVLLVSACSTEPATHWGNAGNLNKDNLPGEAGIEPLECEAGTDDGGTGAACGVSWKNDIYARMVGTDGWQCANAGCHAPGGEKPEISPTDAKAALAGLKAYKMTKSRQELNYIDPSGDPAKSSMECNVSGGCNPAMPIGNGAPLSPGERCKLHTWLACGAPDN